MLRYGIIAQVTAKQKNETVSFLGYDLVEKQKPNPDYVYCKLDDYDLIFKGLDAARSGSLKIENVIKNLDHTWFNIFEKNMQTTEQLEKADKEVTPDSIHAVNGKIIKAIITKNTGETTTQLHQCNEEIKNIIDNMLIALGHAKHKKNEVEKALDAKYEIGQFDIAVKDGVKFLVEHTAKGPVILSNSVQASKVKYALYIAIGAYRKTKEYLDQVNCEGQSGKYFAVFNKGKLQFEKEGPMSELEVMVAKDLIKANK